MQSGGHRSRKWGSTNPGDKKAAWKVSGFRQARETLFRDLTFSCRKVRQSIPWRDHEKTGVRKGKSERGQLIQAGEYSRPEEKKGKLCRKGVGEPHDHIPGLRLGR